MEDATEELIVRRRSDRKTSQCSYLVSKIARKELRQKMKKVSEILKKPEEERTTQDRILVRKNPDLVKASQKNAVRLKAQKDRILEVEDEPELLVAKCEQLVELLRSSRNMVVYTGAGISTAASIPDYRGPNGVWTLLRKGLKLSHQDLSEAEPTFTHMSLSKLYRMGKVKHIVSQNCDGLHLRSGFPRSAISELHGNMYIECCYSCDPHREYVRLFDVTERTGFHRHATTRRCRSCSGALQDTIVHFGEKGRLKSPYRWKEAVRAARRADLILCLGSSLKVLRKYSCLWCMDKKPQHRPKLVIVNLQWTPKDDLATLKLNGKCDTVMLIVMTLLNYQVPDYSRENDPIFKMCTPLLASERKTTCRKILTPLTSTAAVRRTGNRKEAATKNRKQKSSSQSSRPARLKQSSTPAHAQVHSGRACVKQCLTLGPVRATATRTAIDLLAPCSPSTCASLLGEVDPVSQSTVSERGRVMTPPPDSNQLSHDSPLRQDVLQAAAVISQSRPQDDQPGHTGLQPCLGSRAAVTTHPQQLETTHLQDVGELFSGTTLLAANHTLHSEMCQSPVEDLSVSDWTHSSWPDMSMSFDGSLTLFDSANTLPLSFSMSCLDIVSYSDDVRGLVFPSHEPSLSSGSLPELVVVNLDNQQSEGSQVTADEANFSSLPSNRNGCILDQHSLVRPTKVDVTLESSLPLSNTCNVAHNCHNVLSQCSEQKVSRIPMNSVQNCENINIRPCQGPSVTEFVALDVLRQSCRSQGSNQPGQADFRQLGKKQVLSVCELIVKNLLGVCHDHNYSSLSLLLPDIPSSESNECISAQVPNHHSTEQSVYLFHPSLHSSSQRTAADAMTATNVPSCVLNMDDMTLLASQGMDQPVCVPAGVVTTQLLSSSESEHVTALHSPDTAWFHSLSERHITSTQAVPIQENPPFISDEEPLLLVCDEEPPLFVSDERTPHRRTFPVDSVWSLEIKEMFESLLPLSDVRQSCFTREQSSPLCETLRATDCHSVSSEWPVEELFLYESQSVISHSQVNKCVSDCRQDFLCGDNGIRNSDSDSQTIKVAAGSKRPHTLTFSCDKKARGRNRRPREGPENRGRKVRGPENMERQARGRKNRGRQAKGPENSGRQDRGSENRGRARKQVTGVRPAGSGWFGRGLGASKKRKLS